MRVSTEVQEENYSHSEGVGSDFKDEYSEVELAIKSYKAIRGGKITIFRGLEI